MLVSELIKQIRMKCLITQTELAKWSKIDQTSISAYENGTRKPGLLALKKLLDVANKRANMDIKHSDIEL